DLRQTISVRPPRPVKSITRVEGSGTAAAPTLKLSIAKPPVTVDPPSAKPRWIIVMPTVEVIPKEWSSGIQQDVVAKLKDAVELSAKVTKEKEGEGPPASGKLAKSKPAAWMPAGPPSDAAVKSSSNEPLHPAQ